MSDDDRTGTLVDGRFRLEERIDAGGLATVWRATDRERDVPVAVKCETEGSHDRDQVRSHFRGELRWFRRFEGGPVPGSLVRFVDGAVDGATMYVATELIRGGSIADRFDRETSPAPSLETGREIGGAVCRALAFLHRNGVAHLDLKPSNVLVRRSGRPVVIDLNAAVSADADPDVRFRRDPFKPPELTETDARTAPIGPRSDVYALGAMMAFLVTGTPAAETAASIGEWEAAHRRSRGADPPAVLANAIRRATAPDHRDRFDDADELYDALVPFLDVSDRSARLVHEPSGRTVRVRPGDTVGRWTPDRRIPTVVLPDDERYCCPVHAAFEHDGSAWQLRDRSLNGTYVRGNGTWEYVLSRAGRKRRRSADAPLPRPDPATSIRLSDGDLISPVSPAFDCQLVFRTER